MMDGLQIKYRILILLSNGSSFIKSEIARKLSISFCNCINSLGELEKKGLVSFKRDGRKVFASLTYRGEIVASHLVLASKAYEGEVV